MTSRRFGMFFGSTTTCWVVLRKLSKKWFRHVNPFAAVMFEQDLKGRTRRGVFDPCCVVSVSLSVIHHWNVITYIVLSLTGVHFFAYGNYLQPWSSQMANS
uniref:Uncharacterized protein n=1 Tax=Triticum urartu TaxID=4572 RepID=A0A8R7R1E1_TRIUA